MKLLLIRLLNASLFNALLAEPLSYITPGKKTDDGHKSLS